MARSRKSHTRATDPAPEPVLGERVVRPTSELTFSHPVAGLSGRHGDLVYCMRGEKCFVRPYRGQRDARTSDQLNRRKAMGEGQANWKRLSAATREAWHRFALEHVFPPHANDGRAAALAGFNAYVRSQIYRLGQGLPLSTAPPAHLLPGAVLGLEELPPPAGSMVAIRLNHNTPAHEGWSVLFEMSSAMPTLKRQPRDQDLRWAGASAPDSFLPLAPDGSVYLLSNTRFQVEPGKLFGVRARIINPDGLPGPSLKLTFLRKAADPGAWEASQV